MSQFNILMPKMGESIEEATITKWFVKAGDKVVEDQVLLEIATDKVDSEIPSPVAGTVSEIRFETNAIVPVGHVVAVILTGDGQAGETVVAVDEKLPATVTPEAVLAAEVPGAADNEKTSTRGKGARFYSPLVKSIAREEGISFEVLDKITGTGGEGRVTKSDLLDYISQAKQGDHKIATTQPAHTREAAVAQPIARESKSPEVTAWDGDKVVEMDRMRKLIADHMVMSKQVSPHVTSIVEADVTNLVIWREKHKDEFLKKYGEKLTFMPVFTMAAAKALRSYPGVNASVSGTSIIIRKNVNIGIAVSLPSGNLIVPVIKQADQKNIAGLAGDINRLANQARDNKLSPTDIQGGTFTITNFGSFKNIIGTPIINQPQVAILATGSIEKKPAVIETPAGDAIAIRHKMYLSLSYDHRVVDGSLGGMFLREIADHLERWKIDEPL